MALSIDKNVIVNSGAEYNSLFNRAVLTSVLVIVMSCYFFPFEFTFLPDGLNTKIMLAMLAFPLLGIHFLIEKSITIHRELLIAIIFAMIFSVIGYISMDINNSKDTSYANYIISFSTWLLGAYSVCVIIRGVHGYLDFELLFNYLIVVCVIQCFLALLIDYNSSVKLWVDTYISQAPVADVEFLNRVDRLYGVGAAVDVAGTRFSIVLVGLVAVLNTLRKKKSKLLQITLYWVAFVLIAVVGNMISRTTVVGVALAFGYMVFTSNFLKESWGVYKISYNVAIVSVTLILVLVVVYFYQNDLEVREQLRFAFEGFFNWVEEGKWYTGSTDRLNSVMWIWPESSDVKTWLIGKATFDNWHAVGTDIGYCRFVFYSGLLGLITFSVFFIYNAWACNKMVPGYPLFFCFLLALTFIIWLKVATDLFIIYALFYSLSILQKHDLKSQECFISNQIAI